MAGGDAVGAVEEADGAGRAGLVVGAGFAGGVANNAGVSLSMVVVGGGALLQAGEADVVEQ